MADLNTEEIPATDFCNGKQHDFLLFKQGRNICGGYLNHPWDLLEYAHSWNGEVGESLGLETKRTRYSIWIAGPNFCGPDGDRNRDCAHRYAIT